MSAQYQDPYDAISRPGSIQRPDSDPIRYSAACGLNEPRYRQILEAHPDPICRFLPDGTLTYVNCAYCRYFDQTAEALIGSSFFRFMSEVQRGEVFSGLESLKTDRDVFAYEHEIELASGESRWVKWLSRGIFDEMGRLAEIQSVGRDVTDRKLAEIALRRSEARYSNLIKAIPDAVVAYDPHGKATYVNDGFGRLYGWSQEEVIGRSIDFVPEDERQRTLDAWQKTFLGEDVLLETKRRTKGGSLLDIQLRTAILRDRSGHITESIVIHRDITARKKAQEALQQAHDELERRVEERTAELARTNQQLRRQIDERERAEEELRKSEARYRMLVENAPLGIIACDMQGRVIEVNSNLLSVVGSPSQEDTQAINLLTFPPLVEAGISGEFRRCMETEGTRVFECFYTSKWGKSAWLRLHMVPTKDSLGRTNGVQAVVEDITSRKQAEAALCESEERLRAVFETAQDCIFLKDRALVYTHVNPAFLRSLELAEGAVIGNTDKDLFKHVEAGYLKDMETRVLAGQVMEATYVLTTHDLPRTFHCVRVPLRSASGETVGICGIARDVTERKALERRCPRPRGRYSSAVMETTLEQTRLAALSESIVLLLGESGSGKDYLATYLHEHSRRAGGPFFAINCAALAASLAESELFGHESGSFTGSRGRKAGLLEMAEGGTLLLNEIGELSLELQAKLLTFLDTQAFTRVGGDKTIKVNARIVAATNRDLEREAAEGRFREDLYYRLNVFAIRVPSLRERKEDIPSLARDIVETLSLKLGRTEPPLLDGAAIESLSRYHWPGNVRELRNVLERALILCHGDMIRSEDISLPKKKADHVEEAKEIPVAVSVSRRCNMNQALEAAKRLMVESALRRSKGNISSAARLLGVSRDAVRYHIKALGLDVVR
ncbi:MAG: PAS domain S-box protein [Thermodesulfobacteriota bacterium]